MAHGMERVPAARPEGRREARGHRRGRARALGLAPKALKGSRWLVVLGALVCAAAAPAASLGRGALFLVFVKIGAAVFGSGYVLLAFLRADLTKAGRKVDAMVALERAWERYHGNVETLVKTGITDDNRSKVAAIIKMHAAAIETLRDKVA